MEGICCWHTKPQQQKFSSWSDVCRFKTQLFPKPRNSNNPSPRCASEFRRTAEKRKKSATTTQSTPLSLGCFFLMATFTENLNPGATTTREDNPSEALNASAAKPDRVDVAAPTVHGDSNDSKATATAAPVSDTEKKIRRAERFGINLQLSEQEKRDSRAQRFGTGSAAKSSEALKRKARAERFGLRATADDEEKKKARLLRFAPTPKSEDKTKGSDIRPSQPSSSSVSINGKGNIGPKAAIAGKAGGRS